MIVVATENQERNPVYQRIEWVFMLVWALEINSVIPRCTRSMVEWTKWDIHCGNTIVNGIEARHGPKQGSNLTRWTDLHGGSAVDSRTVDWNLDGRMMTDINVYHNGRYITGLEGKGLKLPGLNKIPCPRFVRPRKPYWKASLQDTVFPDVINLKLAEIWEAMQGHQRSLSTNSQNNHHTIT